MHRVHYFATSADAFDACFETHPGLAEGDVIVALAEGVVGLASVYPIAVTRQGGALHHMPAMTREVLLGDEEPGLTGRDFYEAERPPHYGE